MLEKGLDPRVSGIILDSFRTCQERQPTCAAVQIAGTGNPALRRWTQLDTIIPAEIQGVQAWDRYAGMNNNPIRYNDPSGHAQACADGDEGGGCGKGTNSIDIADYYARMRREDGNTTYWAGLPRHQMKILENGGWNSGQFADHVNVATTPPDFWHDPGQLTVAVFGTFGLLKAGYTGAILLGAELATKNPDAANVVIGGYPGYEIFAKASGNTYFDLGKVYNILDRIGFAKSINAQFINNQIDQAKTFLQVSAGGPGTQMEVNIITKTALYTNLGSGWSGFYYIFQPTNPYWRP